MAAKGRDPQGGDIFGGLFQGLNDLIQNLGDLAQKGAELKKSGTFSSSSLGDNKERKGPWQGVYGFSVKLGLDQEEGVKVEPFGNIRQDEETGEAVVQELREPLVDLFDEEEELIILAEMPGIGQDDLRLEIEEDILTLSAERGDKRYHKELLLPQSVTREELRLSSNNGIIEIRCPKRGRHE